MLNCTVCGHDNFPFTSAQINGWASGKSLQMVSKCHKCGARVSDVCPVCFQLHPLNTSHCSVYGIKIQDFQNLKIAIDSRVAQFKELPEVKAATAKIRNAFNFWIKGVGLGIVLCAISSFLSSSVPLVVSFVLTLGCLLFAFVTIVANSDAHLVDLWRKLNPDVMEPVHIFSTYRGVMIDYEPDGIYSGRRFQTDLIEFLLGRAT